MARESNVGELYKQFKSVALTPAQQSYRFRQDRHEMLDPLNKQCPYCLHFSVNSLPENDTATASNKKDLQEWNQAMNVWRDYKKKQQDAEKKNEPPPLLPVNPNTKTVMKQAPKHKPLRMIIEKCMCSVSSCISRHSDTGSSCFVKCRKY